MRPNRAHRVLWIVPLFVSRLTSPGLRRGPLTLFGLVQLNYLFYVTTCAFVASSPP